MFKLSVIVKHVAALIAMGVILLLIAGCEENATSQSSLTPSPVATPTLQPTPATSATMKPSPTLDSAVGDTKAADFRFVLFQGEEVLGASEMALSELQGRPVVLNFWARFCTPCWKEMPELQAFNEEYEDRVQLVGVDVGQFTGLGSPKDAGKLLRALGVTYPAGYTDDARVVQEYEIRAMPTTAFVTADGEVFRIWTGSITREMVTEIVGQMLEAE